MVMHPTVTLVTIVSNDEDMNTRCEALQDLATWLADGAGVDGNAVADYPIEPDVFREEGLHDLAASVRVALVNGDLSGLQGLGYGVTR